MTVVKRRVLVADDNEDSAETLALLLQALGNEVRAVHDGQRAVEEAESFRPDVALLDIGMPGLDGYEVCRRIRQHDWAQTIVIAALTGWSRDEDRDRSEQAGFNHFLVKPVDPKALEELIAGLMRDDRPDHS